MLTRFAAVLLILLGLIFTWEAKAADEKISIVPKVDQRVELLSIVFRLAGNPEYNMSQLAKYTSDIDTYFAPYKEHPAVLRAKSLVATRGVSFDAVMSMAVQLSQPPELKALVVFSDTVPDPRWGEANANEFAQLLRQFYIDTKFGRFFDAHASLYRLAESRFQTVLVQFNVGWYSRFYGEMPTGDFHLLLGMNNGGGNYGPHVASPDGRTDVFAIIGCAQKDRSGDPIFDPSDLDIVIHEFNHSFVNHLVDARQAEFAPAKKIYRSVAEQLRAQAYGDATTMIKESLVRASVICYFESAGENKQQLQARIIREQSVGFVWMDELSDLLRRYEKERRKYPTLANFMGNIVEYYRDLSTRIDVRLQDFHVKCVHVGSLSPFQNHAQNVDAALQEIDVSFDKPLDRTRGYSINYGPEGKEHFPLSGPPEFTSQGALKLRVSLKPNWTYSFVLTPYAFHSVDGYPLESYTVDFKTK